MARTSTRQKMITSAVELLRERGASVTVDAVLERSGAPRGSVYHHFPGGRAQILTEALDAAGSVISGFIEYSAVDGPVVALHRFADFWTTTLVDSDYVAGCPVAGATLGGGDDSDAMRTGSAAIFGQWIDAMTAALERDGVDADRARRLASMSISAFEGAILLARTMRSVEPIDDVVDELNLMLESLAR